MKLFLARWAMGNRKSVWVVALVFSISGPGAVAPGRAEEAPSAVKTSDRRSFPTWAKRSLMAGVVAGAVYAIGTGDSTTQHNVRHWMSEPFARKLALQDIGKKNTVIDYLAQADVGVGVVFYAAGKIAGSQRAQKAGVMATEAWLVNGAATVVLKRIIGRERPNVIGTDGDEFKPFSSNASFPSGHTSSAFAVATAISDNYDSGWVSAISYGLAGVIGASRIIQNQHWTSDVVTGALLGYGSAKLVDAVEERKGWSRRLYTDGRSVVVVQRF